MCHHCPALEDTVVWVLTVWRILLEISRDRKGKIPMKVGIMQKDGKLAPALDRHRAKQGVQSQREAHTAQAH